MALFTNPNEVQNHIFRLTQAVINELMRNLKKNRNLAEKLGDWALADKESRFLKELEMNPNGWRIMSVSHAEPEILHDILKENNIDFRVISEDGSFMVRSQDVDAVNKLFSDHFKQNSTKYSAINGGYINSLDELSDDEEKTEQDDEYSEDEDTYENPLKDEEKEEYDDGKSEPTSNDKPDQYDDWGDDEYGNDDEKADKDRSDDGYSDKSDSSRNDTSHVDDDWYNNDYTDSDRAEPSENNNASDDLYDNNKSDEVKDTTPSENTFDNNKFDDWDDEYTAPPQPDEPQPDVYTPAPQPVSDSNPTEPAPTDTPPNNGFNEDNGTEPYITVMMQDESGDTYARYYRLVPDEATTQKVNEPDILDTSVLYDNQTPQDSVMYGSNESIAEYRDTPVDAGMAVYVDAQDPTKVSVNMNEASFDYFKNTYSDYSDQMMSNVNVVIDNNSMTLLQPGVAYAVQEMNIEVPATQVQQMLSQKNYGNSSGYSQPYQMQGMNSPMTQAGAIQNEISGNIAPNAVVSNPINGTIPNTVIADPINNTVQQPFGGTVIGFTKPERVTTTVPEYVNQWRNNTQAIITGSNNGLPNNSINGHIGGNDYLKTGNMDLPKIADGDRSPAVLNVERFKNNDGLSNHDALRNAAIDATHIKDGYEESNLRKVKENSELGMLSAMGSTFVGIGHNDYLINKGNIIRKTLTEGDISLYNDLLAGDKYAKLDFSSKEGIISSMKSLKDVSADNYFIGKRNAGVSSAYFAIDKDQKLGVTEFNKKRDQKFLKKTGNKMEYASVEESFIAKVKADYADKVKKGIIPKGKYTDADIEGLAKRMALCNKTIAKAGTKIDNFKSKSGSLVKSIEKITKLDDEQNLGTLKSFTNAVDTGLTAANAIATGRANLLELRIQHLSKQAAKYEGKVTKTLQESLKSGKPYKSKYIERLEKKKAKALKKRAKFNAKHEKAKKLADKVSKVTDKIKAPQRKIKEAGAKLAKKAVKATAKQLSKTAAGKAVVATAAKAAKVAKAIATYVANLLDGASEIMTIVAIAVGIAILAFIVFAIAVGLFFCIIFLILTLCMFLFTGDDESSPTMIMYDENGVLLFDKSPLGRIYKALEKNEEDWIKELIDGLYDPDYPPYISDIEEYLDLSGTAIGGGATSANYSMNWENAKKVWDILKDNGFSDYAAAGVLGNLARESGCNPTAFRNAADKGYGIAQWTDYKSTTNWTQMRQQMAAHGYAEDDLVGQTYCMIEEWVKLWYNGDNQSKKNVKAYNMADYKQYPYSSVEEAVYDWCYGAEKPAESTAGMDVRNAAALKAYSMFSPDGIAYGEDLGYGINDTDEDSENEQTDEADTTSTTSDGSNAGDATSDNSTSGTTTGDSTTSSADNTSTSSAGTSSSASSSTGGTTNGTSNSTAKTTSNKSNASATTVDEHLEDGEISLSDLKNGVTPTSVGTSNGINLFKRNPLPIETFAPLCLGTSYASDGVVGPVPFTGAPAEAYKHIRIIDGGQELNFVNQEGETGLSSNIKTIAMMYVTANTVMENGSDNYDDSEVEAVLEAADSGNWFTMASELFIQAASTVFKKITKPVRDVFANIERTRRTNAAITYTHMLFNATHQIGFSLKMVTLPTARGGAGDGGEEMCTGNESQSTPVSAHNEHKGYGCMHYSGFKFDHLNRDRVYYDDVEATQVEPAANVDDSDYACNYPLESTADMEKVMNHWAECWEVKSDGSGTSESGSENGAPDWVNNIDSKAIGYHLSGSGEFVDLRVYTGVTTTTSTDSNGDTTTDTEYDYTDYKLTHKCQGHHTGYYCGGHLRLIVIGTVMNVSKDELKCNYKKYDNKVTESTPYLIGESVKIDKAKARRANDIFDVDMAITHHPSTVNEDFKGWTAGNIESAISPLLENWEVVYGIKEPDYKKLLEQAKAQGSAFALTDEQIVEIIDKVKNILGDDQDRIDRVNAVKTSLFYCGKISYSQAHHGERLKVGGINDCSGFASRVNAKAFKGVIYNTGSFWDVFKSSGRVHPFSDGGIKPGDVILHYDGAIADCSGDHALVYVGVIDGVIYSTDCTGSGTWYRHRDDSYYNNAYYIDMTGMYAGDYVETDSATIYDAVQSTTGTANVQSCSIPNMDNGWTEEGALPVIYYTQCGNKTKIGNKSTIKDGGCGYTSFAMAASYLRAGTDRTSKGMITPEGVLQVIAANNGGDSGAFHQSGGASHSLFSAVSGYLGLACEKVSNNSAASMAKIINALKNGNPVIMNCHGRESKAYYNARSQNTFTKNGHFIVITGYCNDGTFTVNDPSHDFNSNTKFPWSVLERENNTGEWWIISDPNNTAALYANEQEAA